MCIFQLLAEAIKSVTEMNPDLSVERIECMRQIEDVEGGREVLGQYSTNYFSTASRMNSSLVYDFAVKKK